MFGSQLVGKMWETLADKGIGGLFKPWQMRREGMTSLELKRNELLMLAQTEIDVEDIKNGKKAIAFNDVNKLRLINLTNNILNDESKIEPKLDISTLLHHASEHFYANEIKKEINVTRALLVAEQVLSNDQSEPVKENVEEDWLLRWRDNAAATSSEQLQSLWGKVLAGEVKTPGLFSLRTLDFIKNLSQKEAMEIERLFSYVIGDCLIKTERVSRNMKFESEELVFNFLSKMQHLGLITGADGLGLKKTFTSVKTESFSAYLLYDKKVLEIFDEDPSKKIEFEVVVLTELGKQLYSLSSTLINSKYINSVIALIKSQKFKVRIGDLIINSNGEKFSVNNVEV
ncbi:membrane-fusion protein [Rahnella aquatilis HX2]|nr:membrane-fusion protein [Rahnella aquatilis HX2]